MEKLTLQKYIKILGNKEAARRFNCSIATTKAWRYGYRQPSVKKAKLIMKSTNHVLDFDSIYNK